MTTTISGKMFLRRKSAADAASISVPLLDRLIREGRIATVRAERAILIPRAALKRLGDPVRRKK